ncbi:MAG: SMP-30/gluconolactonase/LRE family protein [Mycobacteriaceae bacterium]|nr:SMP-30/gluconolactonase/LRE family protein [Mycobacteriaceae bacterium]
MPSTRAKKPPIEPVRWQPPPIDPLPDVPSATITVVPVPGEGPEDVVVDADGNIWTGAIGGRIIRIPADGGEPDVVADTGGRPLGMHVARDGRVLICDSYRGLLALHPDSGKLETLVESIDGRPLKFCSNVTETADGTIYFTESTSAFHYEHFKAAILEARGRGGLFRLDPNGTVSTLADGLYFANGVTATVDGSALVFAETLARRLSKYWLTGPQAGSVTPLAVNLPAHPDNISTGLDGRIWVAMVTPVNAAADWLAPKAPLVRKLLWQLPDRLQPQIASEVWVVAFDPEHGEVVGGLRTKHPNFGQVTGVVETAGKLWMATIASAAVAYTVL